VVGGGGGGGGGGRVGVGLWCRGEVWRGGGGGGGGVAIGKVNTLITHALGATHTHIVLAHDIAVSCTQCHGNSRGSSGDSPQQGGDFGRRISMTMSTSDQPCPRSCSPQSQSVPYSG